jgi:hypothetical protein
LGEGIQEEPHSAVRRVFRTWERGVFTNGHPHAIELKGDRGGLEIAKITPQGVDKHEQARRKKYHIV